MQAILNVKLNEIDDNLINIIKDLLSKDVEIVIRKDFVKLEEFNKSMSLEKVMGDLSETGYSKEFLNDLKDGFESSTVYAQK